MRQPLAKHGKIAGAKIQPRMFIRRIGRRRGDGGMNKYKERSKADKIPWHLVRYLTNRGAGMRAAPGLFYGDAVGIDRGQFAELQFADARLYFRPVTDHNPHHAVRMDDALSGA